MKTTFLLLALLLAVTAKAGTVTLTKANYFLDFFSDLSGVEQNPTSKSQSMPVSRVEAGGAAGLLGLSAAFRAVASVTLGGTVSLTGNSFFATDTAVSYVVYIEPDGFAPLDISEVPVITTASGVTSCTVATGSVTSAYASVLIGTEARPLFNVSDLCTNGTGQPFSINSRTLFGVRKSIPVLMNAGGTASIAVSPPDEAGPHSVSFYFSGNADPTFQIDPSFPFASDFQILVSPDGTPTDIPEPATYATLACGLAGVLLGRTLTSSRSRAH